MQNARQDVDMELWRQTANVVAIRDTLALIAQVIIMWLLQQFESSNITNNFAEILN